MAAMASIQLLLAIDYYGSLQLIKVSLVQQQQHAVGGWAIANWPGIDNVLDVVIGQHDACALMNALNNRGFKVANHE